MIQKVRSENRTSKTKAWRRLPLSQFGNTSSLRNRLRGGSVAAMYFAHLALLLRNAGELDSLTLKEIGQQVWNNYGKYIPRRQIRKKESHSYSQMVDD